MKFITYFVGTLVLFILILSFSSKAYAACADTDAAGNPAARIYSDANGCHESTGMGVNTFGGSFVCGSFSCSDFSNGHTCMYSQSNGCHLGYGGQGFNPGAAEGGCHYNQVNAGSVTCPTGYSFVLKIVDQAGKPLGGIPVPYYDNDHGILSVTTGTDGTATF